MKQGHVKTRHGQSLVSGEEVEFYERIEPELAERHGIIRRMLGWPTKQPTIYPSTERCEALHGEET